MKTSICINYILVYIYYKIIFIIIVIITIVIITITTYNITIRPINSARARNSAKLKIPNICQDFEIFITDIFPFGGFIFGARF